MALSSVFRGTYSSKQRFSSEDQEVSYPLPIHVTGYMHFPIQNNLPCSSWLHGKQKVLVTVPNRRCYSCWIVRSVLGNRKSSINDNGATEPAGVLLERLFNHTQKLEKTPGDSSMPMDSQFGFHLGTLETDLKKKEDDLEDAERKVVLEQNKINSAKEKFVRRVQEIASACFKQEKLEEELKLANLDLASQALEINDLKLQIEERGKEIRDAHSKLDLKEYEINKMRSELMIKIELVIATESDLEEKASLLNEANEIMNKQEVEIQQLQEAVQEKEDDLKVSSSLRELETEKLKVSETGLEKRNTEWLIAQDELKKLAAEASKRPVEVNATAEGFQRVRKLLTDVRSELLLSQKALGSSRNKMKDHELLLQKKLMELEEEKRSLISYMTNLKDARAEVEGERGKLRAAKARNKELERNISAEKELIAQLQADLNREKSSLEKEILEKSFLQEQVDQECSKLLEAQSLLEAKETELIEARLEIQQLKSEHESLKFILEDRDSELCDAKKSIEDANKGIIESKSLMRSREDQLMQTENKLKDTEEHVRTMQLDLNDTILSSSEAETVVERILELTKKLVNSVDDDNCVGSSPLLKELDGESEWEKKHLETELVITRESLRTKVMEVVAAQRALAMKDEELKRLHDRLEKWEKELKEKDATDLMQLYSMPLKRIGERNTGDLVIEKLKIEAARLEAEAATTALYKLTEMSRELLTKTSVSIDTDSNFEAPFLNGSDSGLGEVDWGCLSEFRKEVSRLSTLTERLVKEAGVITDVGE